MIRPPRLLCPCCRHLRPIAGTPLLRIEAEWSANGGADPRLEPGWSIVAAEAKALRWACDWCIRDGRALVGQPALQTWCDFKPYFAFFDVDLRCEDCQQAFVFGAAEQRYWYETLKFWVQSRPKRCLACRRARRLRRLATRQAQPGQSGPDMPDL